jgi:transcriptional regulator with XRE-family HTH domain
MPSSEAPPGSVGERLYLARKGMEQRLRRDVTKKEVAAVLGVHAVTYGDWERGRYSPPLETITQLADLYAVSPSWLAWGIVEGELRAGEPNASNAVPVIGTANESDVSPAPVQAPRPHKEISRHQKAPLHPIRRRPDEGKGRKGA